ncbi:hypothetical protein V5O48_015733 [Marasmius crinis-equi]|uniref:F-box domain-containing protein n=1 Tax=Marasmius crinis-equi TaxID=585013 RepID=A0ABR3ETS4_9AGAR
MSGKRKSKSQAENEAGKQPAKRVKRKGALKSIQEMPLDIVYEIFSNVTPYDLLKLSWTSKKLREILMSKSSTSIWKRSRETIGMPEPIPSISEPAFAFLLFDKHCYVRGPLSNPFSTTADELADYDDRFAGTFVKKSFKPIPDQKGLPESLLKTLPYESLSSDLRRSLKLPPRFNLFMQPESEELINEYLSLSGDKRTTWLSRRVEVYERDFPSLMAYQKWVKDYGDQREHDIRRIRIERCKAITSRMHDLGWDLLALDDCNFRAHRLVNQPKPLTERIWKNIRPELEEVIEPIQDSYYNEIRHSRYSTLHDYLDFWVENRHISLKRRDPETLFNDALEKLPLLLEDWTAKRTEKVLEVLQKHQPGATKEDLHKVTALFRCTSKFCAGRTWGYPGILTHACVYDPSLRSELGVASRLPYWLPGEEDFKTNVSEIRMDEEAVEMTKKIATICGVVTHEGDVSSVRISEMLRINPIVECVTSGCNNFGQVMCWSSAINHRQQCTLHAVPDSMIEEDDLQSTRPATGFKYIGDSDRWFLCTHEGCEYRGRKERLQEHLVTVHGLPRLPLSEISSELWEFSPSTYLQSVIYGRTIRIRKDSQINDSEDRWDLDPSDGG